MILLDADKAGEKAKQEYIKIFGDFISPNIKTYKDFAPEIGDVMMEDVLSDDEKLSITQRYENSATEYKKSAFNTAIQSALIKNEEIVLSDATLNKFDNLLKQLDVYSFA